MSIFGKIMSSIFGRAGAASASPSRVARAGRTVCVFRAGRDGYAGRCG